jgi:sugar lactone lactonase YvrE
MRPLLSLLLLLVLTAPGSARDLDALPELEAVETVRIPLPTDGVRGLLFQGGRLILLATENRGLSAPDTSYVVRLLRLDPDDGTVETLAVEQDGYESGLASDGEAWWSSGSLLGSHAGIYRISPGDGSVLETLPSPGHHPAGLAWDGSWLWQVDADARKLMRLEVEEGKVSRKVPSPAFYPTGLAYDGYHFWNADATTGRIYRLKGFNGEVDAVVSASAFHRPGAYVSLTHRDGGLWAVAAEDSVAVRLEILP